MAEQVVAYKGAKGVLYPTEAQAEISLMEAAIQLKAQAVAVRLQHQTSVCGWRMPEALLHSMGELGELVDAFRKRYPNG